MHFSSFAEWNEFLRQAYSEIFGDIVKSQRKIIPSSVIDTMKQKHPFLKDLSITKIRNKMNAEVQKLKRLNKQVLQLVV